MRKDNIFSKVEQISKPRSVFNRDHQLKTTLDGGDLVPIFIDQMFPGDTVKMQATAFSRFQTLYKPIMDNVFLEIFWFSVDNHLLWQNFTKFNGEQDDPGDSIDYTIPTVTSPVTTGWTPQSMGDYLGIPIGVTNLETNALFFRAYNMVYNEWFRDQNLIDKIPFSNGDGPDAAASYTIQKRAKRPDYYTSALPWPQKGDEIMVPLGTSAPVIGDGQTMGLHDGTTELGLFTDAALGVLDLRDTILSTPYGTTATVGVDGVWNKSVGLTTDPDNSGIIADLSQASAATVNQLRRAVALQKVLELDGRTGTRYPEIVKAHFGVITSDLRLDRPKFLGSTSTRFNINQVEQQGEAGTTPQGNLAGYGTAQSNGGFMESFNEHSIVIGIANVRADITYQQGLDRKHSVQTRYDMYLPMLANLGEQAVLNKEIFAQGTTADDDVFGYQEAWSHMRYFPSLITGKFRSDAAGTLEVWHLAQDFASLPALNQAFIEDNTDFDRVISVTSEPEFFLDIWFNYQHARVMPTFSTPGFSGRF